MYTHPEPHIQVNPIPVCPNAALAAQVAGNIIACVSAKYEQMTEQDRERMLGMAEDLIRPIGNYEVHVPSDN